MYFYFNGSMNFQSTRTDFYHKIKGNQIRVWIPSYISLESNLNLTLGRKETLSLSNPRICKL